MNFIPVETFFAGFFADTVVKVSPLLYFRKVFDGGKMYDERTKKGQR